MASRVRLRVAVFGPPVGCDARFYVYAAKLACAADAAGGAGHLITDHLEDPLQNICSSVSVHRAPDFRSNLPPGLFDWVIVVPPPILQMDFHEAAIDFAASSQARLAWINFDPVDRPGSAEDAQRDTAFWRYWQDICPNGGLVLSSTRRSHQSVRESYRAEANSRWRFEVWAPPSGDSSTRSLGRDGRRSAMDLTGEFSDAAIGLADILLRSMDVVAPLEPRDWRVSLEPVSKDALPKHHPKGAPGRRNNKATMPAIVRSARITEESSILVSVLFCVRPGANQVDAISAAGQRMLLAWTKLSGGQKYERIVAYLKIPSSLAGESLRITISGVKWALAEAFHLKIDHVEKAKTAIPVKCVVTSDLSLRGARQITGWIIASVAIDEVWIGNVDQSAWHAAQVEPISLAALKIDPHVRAACCRFTFIFPKDFTTDSQAHVVMMSKGQSIMWRTGWPLR